MAFSETEYLALMKQATFDDIVKVYDMMIKGYNFGVSHTGGLLVTPKDDNVMDDQTRMLIKGFRSEFIALTKQRQKKPVIKFTL